MNSAEITVTEGGSLPQASRLSGAMTAVAIIGTLVGMVGVGHAMYDSLIVDGAARWAAGLEATVAALFLEGVVMVCARRAHERATNSKAARLDVAIVLGSASISGLVSGIHAGLGTTAGLFRFAVPIIAALVWLGDVVTVLRARREVNHERAMRNVLIAVGRRQRAELTGKARHIHKADLSLVKAMSDYAAAEGARSDLVRRLEEMHHRGDLLSPIGPSPWQKEARAVEREDQTSLRSGLRSGQTTRPALEPRQVQSTDGRAAHVADLAARRAEARNAAGQGQTRPGQSKDYDAIWTRMRIDYKTESLPTKRGLMERYGITNSAKAQELYTRLKAYRTGLETTNQTMDQTTSQATSQTTNQTMDQTTSQTGQQGGLS